MDPMTGLPPGQGQPNGLPDPNEQAFNINPRDPSNDITQWLMRLLGPRQPGMVPANVPVNYGSGRYGASISGHETTLPQMPIDSLPRQDPLREKDLLRGGLPQPNQPLRAQQPQDQGFQVSAPNGQKVKLTKDEYAKYNRDKDGFWLDYQGGKFVR